MTSVVHTYAQREDGTVVIGSGVVPLCAVEGCENQGQRQVCPFDGRYHHHGRIHYENDHPLLGGMRFRDLAQHGWLGICDPHYVDIKHLMED